MDSVELKVENFEGIVITKSNASTVGYRFYPDKIRGEGFFLSCFRKKHGDDSVKLRPAKPAIISAKEKKIISEWANPEGTEFLRFKGEIIALPVSFLSEFLQLQPLLNIVYAGVRIGEVLKEKLVPDHALAQNLILSENVNAFDLDYEDAIKYLQRQELSVHPARTGWQVVRYQKHNLGWINALKNRINNYYPKEIRILKAYNNTAFEK